MKRQIKAGSSDRVKHKFSEARSRLNYRNIEKIYSDIEQFLVDLRYSKDVQSLLTQEDVEIIDTACDILGDLAKELSHTPGFD